LAKSKAFLCANAFFMFLGFFSPHLQIFFSWFSFVLLSACYSNFLLLCFNFCYSFFCIFGIFFLLFFIWLAALLNARSLLLFLFSFLAIKWIFVFKLWKSGGKAEGGGRGRLGVMSASRLKVTDESLYRCESVNWHASALVFGFWNTKLTERKSICFFCAGCIPEFWRTGVWIKGINLFRWQIHISLSRDRQTRL